MSHSNSDTDWGLHYDWYETENRKMYLEQGKEQNYSHHELIKNKLKSLLNQNKKFCEIGFGAGITLRLMSRYFKEVFGLDISKKNVELTRKEMEQEGYKNIKLDYLDIMKYDNKFDNKFDVISFIHGLDHFSDSDYDLFFENIKKYLKPNGVFTGALPNNLGPNYRMCPNCNHVFEIDGHLSKHTKETLKELFNKQNFDIIYLSSFNLAYYKKKNGLIKYMYRKLNPPKSGGGQLEFIVKAN